MTVVQSPGVYIEELPRGVPPIPALASGVCGFVGRARRGPVDAALRCASWQEFERRFGGPWRGSGLPDAVAHFFANGGRTAVVARAAAPAAAPAALALPSPDGGSLALEAADPGAWGNRLRATIAHGALDGAPAPAGAERFHLVLEELAPASAQVLRRELQADLALTEGDERGVERVLARDSELARAVAVPAQRPRPARRRAFRGGRDGGASGLDLAAGLQLLAREASADLLCLPPPARAGETPLQAWREALRWCEREGVLLLVDPPRAWRDAAAAARLAGGYEALRSSYAAFYFPRVVAEDPLRPGSLRAFPPCGAVAGVIARTDAQRGIWKAPAGVDATLAGVARLEHDLDDAQIGLLNPRAINALRTLPGRGPLVWGARTAVGADGLDPAWKYVPVRRLALFVERSLDRGLQWVVSEPNGAPTWARVRASVEGFLQGLWRQGALQGSTPSVAWFVRCDASTMTPEDLALGRLVVEVGLATLKPAEFVVLRIAVRAGSGA